MKEHRQARISKAKLKEDLLVVFTLATLQFLKKNLRRVIIITALILVAIALLNVFLWYKADMNRRAQNQLAKALDLYHKQVVKETTAQTSQDVFRSDKEKYTKALEAFEEITVKYSFSDYLPDALFYMGNCYYYLGEFDKAIDIYNRYLKRYPRKALAPAAWESLGYAYEGKGNYPQAIEAYEKITKNYSRSYLNVLAYLNLARCYEELKEWAKAREVYQKVISSFPGTIWANEAQIRLSWLEEKEKR